jgi:hypothetical protein
MPETERSATATTDHDEIRDWVEKRGGHPAMVAATERNDQPGGMLRIDFDDPDGSEDVGLHRISWEEFFKVFDKNDLAFLRVDSGGSRFNKFVQAQDANS